MSKMGHKLTWCWRSETSAFSQVTDIEIADRTLWNFREILGGDESARRQLTMSRMSKCGSDRASGHVTEQ
jgi:hypothetical protein